MDRSKLFEGLKSAAKPFFTPTVITVAISAFLGPYAIQSVNNNFNKTKIQQEIIGKVLEYTDEADFSQRQAIEKISIISQMVNENESVFGLSFDSTNSYFRKLIENEYRDDISLLEYEQQGLTKEKIKIENDIKQLNEEVLVNQSEITTLNKKSSSLSTQIKALNRDKQKNKSQIEKLEKEKSEVDNQSKLLQNANQAYQQTINTLEMENESKERKLKETELLLATERSKSDEKDRVINALQITLKDSTSNLVAEWKALLEDVNTKWQSDRNEIEALRKDIKELRLIKDSLQNGIDTLLISDIQKSVGVDTLKIADNNR